MEQRKDIPAFPLPVADQECCGRFESGYGGMTLRDYFAAKAMQAVISIPQAAIGGGECLAVPKHADIIADAAYEMADAMLAAREK